MRRIGDRVPYETVVRRQRRMFSKTAAVARLLCLVNSSTLRSPSNEALMRRRSIECKVLSLYCATRCSYLTFRTLELI